MIKHLIYTTYGENTGTVYKTQVIELLNNWAQKKDWKITLIQIADNVMFDSLSDKISRISIRRNSKLLNKRYVKEYIKSISSKLEIENGELVYFSSRGYFAFNIINKFIEIQNIRYNINNIDVRGVSEEFKYSLKRYFVYKFLDLFYKKVIKDADSITTVSSNLKRYLISKYKVENDGNIQVVPTLSIMKYAETHNDKKNIAYIGKIAWVSKKIFITKVLNLRNILSDLGWEIIFFGTPLKYKELEVDNITFYKRMSPNELFAELTAYHSGLVLRDNSIVNKVSAPCKISDYLCLGIPVIYSGQIGSLEDFQRMFPDASRFIINIEELSLKNNMINEYVQITELDRAYLAKLATSYFGIDVIVNRYIKIFDKNKK